MKTRFSVLLITVMLSVPLRAEPTAEAIEAARLTNSEDVLLPVMHKTYESQIAEYRAEGLNQEELDMVWAAYAAFARKVAGDPDMISSIANEYDKRFSRAELKDVVVFYKSAAGKKMLAGAAKMKATTDKFMDAAKDKYKPMLVEGMDRVSALVKKRLTKR